MNEVEVYVPERSGLGFPGESDAVSLRLPDGLSIEDWEVVGRKLCAAEKSIMWWIGDWINYGTTKYFGRDGYGKKFERAIAVTGFSEQTLRHASSMSNKFELCRRMHNLSWSHHQSVASLPISDADEMLNKAAEEGWSRDKFNSLVSQQKAARKINAAEPSGETCEVSDLYSAAAEGRKYGTIYADPPWRYDNQSTRAATGNHYDGMSIDEICALPVKELAAKDSHLHLWTTNAFLFECPKIFEAWGFEFRSTFVWVKPQMGIGNYWRNSHEILLTAIRGDAKRFNDHSMMSWIEKSRGAHSAKPEEIRTMIERASPGPYLELFARRRADNWDAWGNQIEKTLFHPGAVVAA